MQFFLCLKNTCNNNSKERMKKSNFMQRSINKLVNSIFLFFFAQNINQRRKKIFNLIINKKINYFQSQSQKNVVKSYNYKSKRKKIFLFGLQQYLMQSNYKTKLIQVTKIFDTESKQKKLMKKAEQHYLLCSFKIKGMSSQQASNSYDRLCEKYELKQISYIDNDWNKNQRRLFLWYLICYCEEKKIQFNDLSFNEWENMSKIFFNKSPLFLKFQALTIVKNIKRYHWSCQDDKLLQKFVKQKGSNSWNQVSKQIYFYQDQGKFISPKQCRERWFNHVCTQINKHEWTNQQDIKILKLSQQQGKKWSLIARKLNTNRTEHMVKNRYHSILHRHKTKKSQNQSTLLKKVLKVLQQNNKVNELENIQKKQQLEVHQIKKVQKPQIQRVNGNNQSKPKNKFIAQTNKFIRPIPKKQFYDMQNPQDMKNIRQILEKSDKGVFSFINQNTNQQIILPTPSEGIQGAMPFSMTPNTIKAISPFGLGFFKTFDHCANIFQKRRLDGSTLFSPAAISPAAISPATSAFNRSTTTSPGFRRSMQYQDLQADLKKITNKRSGKQIQQQ